MEAFFEVIVELLFTLLGRIFRPITANLFPRSRPGRMHPIVAIIILIIVVIATVTGVIVLIGSFMNLK